MISDNDHIRLQELADQYKGGARSWRWNSADYMLWVQRVRSLIRRAHPDSLTALAEFDGHCYFRTTPTVSTIGVPDDPDYPQRNYLRTHDAVEAFMEAMVEDFEARYTPETDKQPTVTLIRQLDVFIAHDGPTTARVQVQDFIESLGANALIADSQPTMGRSINDKVQAVLTDCQFAIAIATKERSGTQDDKQIARSNVINELPRIREAMGQRWMMLVEEGVSMPSNESHVAYDEFRSSDMAPALKAIVRELRGHRMLIVNPPVDD